MMTAPPTVTTRDRTGAIVDLDATGWTDLTATPSLDRVGTWSATWPAHLTPAILTTPGAGVIIHRTGDVIASGHVTNAVRAVTLDTSTGAVTETVTITGALDDIALDDRLAHPEPATPAPPYTTSAYDIVTGPADTVLADLINRNAGPAALPPRRTPGLTITPPPGTAPGVTVAARWQPLGDLVRAVAVAADLVVRVIDTLTGTRAVTITAPVDRSATVRLSPALGNLRSSTAELAAPTGNAWVAGGGGEGTARLIVESTDPDSINRWRRIERFRDRRDTVDPAAIAVTLDEERAASAERWAVTVDPIDTDDATYGIHYRLGDLVTVDTLTGPAVQMIRAVTARWTAAGPTVTPTVATPRSLPAGSPRIFADTDRATARIGNLERT